VGGNSEIFLICGAVELDVKEGRGQIVGIIEGHVGAHFLGLIE
jgi:hypothetical protein